MVTGSGLGQKVREAGQGLANGVAAASVIFQRAAKRVGDRAERGCGGVKLQHKVQLVGGPGEPRADLPHVGFGHGDYQR